MTHSASEANYNQMWYGLRLPTGITPLVALGRPDAANRRAGSKWRKSGSEHGRRIEPCGAPCGHPGSHHADGSQCGGQHPGA